jgi:hypothetical protein
MKKYLLPLLFLLACFHAFSQDENSIFVINSFTFNIRGVTRPTAIINKAELTEGREIIGLENLVNYVTEKRQLLLNERVLESVSIYYIIGQSGEDGKYPVNLYIHIEDTWNKIVLPHLEYTSNTGFELTLKFRNYNFLGTMAPLEIDIGYIYSQNKKNSFLFNLDSDTPFTLFSHNWHFKFYNAFAYRPVTEAPFYYLNVTGISVEQPVGFTTLTLGFDESLFLNNENPEGYRDQYGYYQSGVYMSSSPYVSWKIPTGLEIGNYGGFVYTPEISAVFNHEFSDWPLADYIKGPFLKWKHSLLLSRINWVGNFRRGIEVLADNSYSFDFYNIDKGINALDIAYSLAGTGHFIINDFFGISGRLMFRHWLYNNTPLYNDAGDAVRGVLDSAITADYMLSLNFDFPFRVLRFRPSQWNPKMRFFDFEMHIVPIIDFALYNDPVNNVTFSMENAILTGGAEIIIFPAVMRSLYLRVSFAVNISGYLWNTSRFPEENNREIFIGVGHHY